MPSNVKQVKELEQKLEAAESQVIKLQAQVADNLKTQLNTQVEENQYLIKLTKSAAIKIIVSVITFITGVGGTGGVTAFNYIFDIKTAGLKRDYDDKIFHLQKEIDQYKEATTTSEKRIKELIDTNEFLKLQSLYDRTEREYTQSKTEENLKKLLIVQDRYVRYIKFKNLENTKVISDQDFAYFSDKAKYIDGQPYPIPNDVLLKMKEEKLDAKVK